MKPVQSRTRTTYLLTYLLSHSRGTPLSHLHCPVGQLRSRVVGPEYVGLDAVYFADTTTPSRLSRGPSTVASIPAGSRCGGSYETPFAESGVSHVR